MIGVKLRSHGSSRASSGRVLSSTCSVAGRPRFDTRTSGSRSTNRPLQVRREAVQVDQQGRQLARGGPQLRDQRVGVVREPGQALGGRPALAQERREHAERVRQLGVAARDRLPGPVRVLDQVAQLALALAERVEHVAGVAHEALRRAALLAQHLEHLVRVLRERREQRRARRSDTPRCPSPPRRPGRTRSRSARRVSGSKPRRISSSSTVSATLPGSQLAAVRHLAGARGPGRELHVGLPQQRLLAQDRARVLRNRRVARVDLDLGVRQARVRVRLLLLDAAHPHAGDPHVRLLRRAGWPPGTRS